MDSAEKTHLRTRATPLRSQRDLPSYQEDVTNRPKGKHGSQFLMGLSIAGMASSLLSTVFALFHVDVFLRAYDLPLSTYATGNFLFAFINTANDVAGAWIVDAIATESSRSSIVGVSGCLFAICFLTPFFRWNTGLGLAAGAHFVTSMSLYDTMYSFMTILVGSIVTDDHTMSDRARVRFMASGKMVNLVASFIAAKIGLEMFAQEDMRAFRTFITILCLLVCIFYIIGQWMMTPGTIFSWKSLNFRRKGLQTSSSDSAGREKKSARRKLRLRQVVRDLWTHDNFRAWVGMDVLLECQHSFVTSFLKTFVDRLVVDAGVSKDLCDWLLSLQNPIRQIAAIVCYLPIQQRGYHKVYMWMFRSTILLSFLCLIVASPSHPYLIILYLLIHTVMTGAVRSAGYHLAMSDMVLEMKQKHASEGRLNEPSLAGLFMGANALLCKPMKSLLPMVAALLLGETDFSSNEQSEGARQVLFYLLVVPPLLFSCLQMLSWSNYNLRPERTSRMREELQRLASSSDSSYGA